MGTASAGLAALAFGCVVVLYACGEADGDGPDIPDPNEAADVPGDHEKVDSERWFDAPDPKTGRDFRCLVARGYYDPAIWCYEVKQ